MKEKERKRKKGKEEEREEITPVQLRGCEGFVIY